MGIGTTIEKSCPPLSRVDVHVAAFQPNHPWLVVRVVRKHIKCFRKGIHAHPGPFAVIAARSSRNFFFTIAPFSAPKRIIAFWPADKASN